MVNQEKQNNLILQGSILAMAGIVTRLIGLAYRFPMANILGAEGNGIYTVAFGIYNIALTLSSYSLPLAVSKLMAQRLSRNEYRNACQVFSHACLFALISGAAAGLAIYLGAGALARFYARPGLEIPLRIVAPTVFVMAFLGVLRGYFQGHGTMVPTALSQILEQVVNAAVSVYAAWQLAAIYQASGYAAAYGAAGGVTGTLMGAVTALAFLLAMILKSHTRQKERWNADISSYRESGRSINRALTLTIIPVILSQTVYQIGNTLDDLLFGNIMVMKGMESGAVSALQGVFNSQYNLLINVPVAVATAMSASLVPGIAALRAMGKEQEVHQKIASVIKVNMVIAFPAMVGLMVLAKPIMMMLFPNISGYWDVAAGLLVYGSSAVIFYTLSTITSAILQSINHMRLPVFHAAAALALHVAVVAPLLYKTDLGVFAVMIGNILFPMMISLLNFYSICRYLGYRQERRRTFVIPGVCSLIMGGIAAAVYSILFACLHRNTCAVLSAILAGGAGYLFLIGKSRCFSEMELREFHLKK